MVEASRLDLVEVGLADKAPVGHEGDPPDAEAPPVVGHDAAQGRRVPGVAGEHVVCDGDALAGHEEADHDLGPVITLVPAVAAVAGGEQRAWLHAASYLFFVSSPRTLMTARSVGQATAPLQMQPGTSTSLIQGVLVGVRIE